MTFAELNDILYAVSINRPTNEQRELLESLSGGGRSSGITLDATLTYDQAVADAAATALAATNAHTELNELIDARRSHRGDDFDSLAAKEEAARQRWLPLARWLRIATVNVWFASPPDPALNRKLAADHARIKGELSARRKALDTAESDLALYLVQNAADKEHTEDLERAFRSVSRDDAEASDAAEKRWRIAEIDARRSHTNLRDAETAIRIAKDALTFPDLEEVMELWSSAQRRHLVASHAETADAETLAELQIPRTHPQLLTSHRIAGDIWRASVGWLADAEQRLADAQASDDGDAITRETEAVNAAREVVAATEADLRAVARAAADEDGTSPELTDIDNDLVATAVGFPRGKGTPLMSIPKAKRDAALYGPIMVKGTVVMNLLLAEALRGKLIEVEVGVGRHTTVRRVLVRDLTPAGVHEGLPMVFVP